ncbi:ankyrin repeat and MYND domain-containing protein 2-like [Mercenaria mercenaria]|uniref:ankyrin repeat and MYND domain-containing protein 2-like n=1 Tax=Mercenaria mercenaria TaxID=6596 RepID=UPI00234F7E0A|nr:ankyrin repeat and MYND domain-containing protein 2-like [Mercenaria mercenaria]
MESQKKKHSFPELSENEKKLIDAINRGAIQEVKILLQEKDVKFDCLDESGMTPLQHAAFRGKYDVAELLLSVGSNVNSNHHENGYSALMFAALSGNPEVTRLMLQNGAKKDTINSVGRNAAQMAAFVGQHQCVAVINNYYDKHDLEYYTIPRGQEKEPKLPERVLPSLLELLNMSNMHPVKISQHLKKHTILMNESYKVCKVLDHICEKAMKSRDTDDVMAMKAHYFATVIRKAKDEPSLDDWIKKLVRGRVTDGHPEFQDQLIRQALKEFPYVESQLLQNMVRQLSGTRIGDHPTSLNILNQGVNGQKFSFDEDEDCTTCGEPKSKKCSACKMAHYCSQDCQKLHWFVHKKFCKKLAEQYKRLEKMKEENKNLEEGEKQTNGETKENKGGAKSKTGAKEESDGHTSFLSGHPGASQLLGTGEEEDSVPDINKFLDDPEIVRLFQDPSVAKAFKEVNDDPANISKYQDNEKIQEIIQKIPKKLSEFKAAMAGDGAKTTAGKSEGATGGVPEAGAGKSEGATGGVPEAGDGKSEGAKGGVPEAGDTS